MFIQETNHTATTHLIFDLPFLGFWYISIKEKQHKNNNKGCRTNINTACHGKTASRSLPPFSPQRWTEEKLRPCTSLPRQRSSRSIRRAQHSQSVSVGQDGFGGALLGWRGTMIFLSFARFARNGKVKPERLSNLKAGFLSLHCRHLILFCFDYFWWADCGDFSPLPYNDIGLFLGSPQCDFCSAETSSKQIVFITALMEFRKPEHLFFGGDKEWYRRLSHLCLAFLFILKKPFFFSNILQIPPFFFF